jgi:6-phosphofructokinase 1
MNITVLGERRLLSPIRRAVSDRLRIPEQIVRDLQFPAATELLFELAGPREKIFFDPKQTRAGIVTCGGLCPGMNDVIRSLFLELHHAYGVREVLGFRGGFQGLDPGGSAGPIVLTTEMVDDIS